MATTTPFTAYIKLTPQRPARRAERHRELQRLGMLIREAIKTYGTTIHQATPGGGQARNHSRWTDYVSGVAVAPQMGDEPARATIVGFYDTAGDDALGRAQPHAQRQIFSGGAVWQGAGGNQPWSDSPTTATRANVKDLKTTIENSLRGGLPASVSFEVYRIDYAGTVWGNRGQHFPR